jgi:replication-associated recombination protein RarA
MKKLRIKYQPKKLENFIFPSRIKNKFKNGLNDHELFYGSPGMGKTTFAKFLGSNFQDFLYVNASMDGLIENLREDSYIFKFCKESSLNVDDSLRSDKKVVLFDEIEGVSIAFLEALRGFMDVFTNTYFIATTNHIDKIPDNVISRFNGGINFDPINDSDKNEYLNNYKSMLYAIVVNGEKKSIEKNAIVKLADSYFPDFRMSINKIDQILKSGKEHITLLDISDSIYENKEIYETIFNNDLDPISLHIQISKYNGRSLNVISDLNKNIVDYIIDHQKNYIALIPHFIIINAKYAAMLPTVDSALVMKSLIYELKEKINQFKNKVFNT